MAFQMSYFYSHITICSFYAPLRGETSVDLALGPSVKIPYIAIIPLYCVASPWLCQEAPAVLTPLLHIYIHTRANRHTTFFKQGEIFLTCALSPRFLLVLHKHFVCIPVNSLSFLSIQDILCWSTLLLLIS